MGFTSDILFPRGTGTAAAALQCISNGRISLI
jgi:hypothetical protein